jgi:uncharacterized membrane protein YbhN (UPF0104 family)
MSLKASSRTGADSNLQRTRARSLAVRVAVVAILFAAVVVLVAQLVPGAERRLADASPGWLAVAVAAEVVACAGYALLFHAVFSRPPHTVPATRSAQIAVGELAGYAIVPTGLGGPALRFWALRRGGMPWRAIAVRTVAHAPLFNVPYVIAAVALGVGVALGVAPGHAPLLPGGIGGVEPVMLGVFAASGVSTGLAAAAIVCYRAIALGIQGLAGTAAAVALAHELRAAAVE